MNRKIDNYLKAKIESKIGEKPFSLVLYLAYKDEKITDEEALLFINNSWKRMHGFPSMRYTKMSYKNKGAHYKKFVWSQKVSKIINEKLLKVRQEYENMNRIGVPLDRSIGSKTWDWEFWRELLNVISDGHV